MMFWLPDMVSISFELVLAIIEYKGAPASKAKV